MEQTTPVVAFDQSVRYSYCEVGEKANRTPLLITRSRIIPDTGWPKAAMSVIAHDDHMCRKPHTRLKLTALKKSQLTLLYRLRQYRCTVLHPGPSLDIPDSAAGIIDDNLDAILAALDNPIVTDSGDIGDAGGARKLGLLKPTRTAWRQECCHKILGYPTPRDILHAFRETTASYGGQYTPVKYQFIDKNRNADLVAPYLPVLVGNKPDNDCDGVECYPFFTSGSDNGTLHPCASFVKTNVYNEFAGVICTARGLPEDRKIREMFVDYVADTARTMDYCPVNEFSPGRLWQYFSITAQELLYTDFSHINEVIVAAYAMRYRRRSEDSMYANSLTYSDRDLYTATVAGAHCLVTQHRIKRDTISFLCDTNSKGYHVYDIRLADDTEKPSTLEAYVRVNYGGTVISDREIKFPKGQDWYELTPNEVEEVSFQDPERDKDNLGKDVSDGDVRRILDLYFEKYPPIA